MLKTRIITAIALGLPVLWLVFSENDNVFWWFLFVIALLGMWEWTRLSGIIELPLRLILTLFFAIAVFLVHQVNIYTYFDMHQVFIFLSLWWLIASFRVVNSLGVVKKISKFASMFRYIEGSILLLGLLLSLELLHIQSAGPWLVLTLFFLIWGADSFAYFAGRKWGHKKLLPRVSPGKTWAGVVGGMFGGTLVSSGVIFFHDTLSPYLLWVVPVIIVSIIFSVLGDLFESMYKREVGLKDSSHLLPGHGGILDRIDSLLAAAPIFVTGLLFAGVIA